MHFEETAEQRMRKELQREKWRKQKRRQRAVKKREQAQRDGMNTTRRAGS